MLEILKLICPQELLWVDPCDFADKWKVCDSLLDRVPWLHWQNHVGCDIQGSHCGGKGELSSKVSFRLCLACHEAKAIVTGPHGISGCSMGDHENLYKSLCPVPRASRVFGALHSSHPPSWQNFMPGSFWSLLWARKEFLIGLWYWTSFSPSLVCTLFY